MHCDRLCVMLRGVLAERTPAPVPALIRYLSCITDLHYHWWPVATAVRDGFAMNCQCVITQAAGNKKQVRVTSDHRMMLSHCDVGNPGAEHR